MPYEPPWTAEEDRLLLNLADSLGLQTSCKETAKVMNEKATEAGINMRTYYASTIFFRLNQLVKPTDKFISKELRFNDAHKYDLGRKRDSDQASGIKQTSDCPQTSAGGSSSDAQNQSMDKEDAPVPQLYGEPELYEDLFPDLIREGDTDKA